MPGSSSRMSYAPQGVKGFDDDDLLTKNMIYLHLVIISSKEVSTMTQQYLTQYLCIVQITTENILQYCI